MNRSRDLHYTQVSALFKEQVRYRWYQSTVLPVGSKPLGLDGDPKVK